MKTKGRRRAAGRAIARMAPENKIVNMDRQTNMVPANNIQDSDKQSKRIEALNPQSTFKTEKEKQRRGLQSISRKRGKVAVNIENSANNWKHLEGCPPPCHRSHIWNRPQVSLSTTEVWPCRFFSRSYISLINFKSISWKMSCGIKRTIEEWIIYVTSCSF